MATNTIKRLGQVEILTLQANPNATNIVTAAGTASGTMVKLINIINLGASSQTVEVFIDSTGAGAYANHVYKAILAAGDTAAFEGTLIIPSGSFLTARVSVTNVTGAGVVFTVHGMEMV